jgi:hypothetical protein
MGQQKRVKTTRRYLRTGRRPPGIPVEDDEWLRKALTIPNRRDVPQTTLQGLREMYLVMPLIKRQRLILAIQRELEIEKVLPTEEK